MKFKRFNFTPVDPAAIILLTGLIVFMVVFIPIEISTMNRSEPSLAGPAAVSTDSESQNSVESLVNAERTKAGKQPFTTNETLGSSACAKADHMLSQDYLGTYLTRWRDSLDLHREGRLPLHNCGGEPCEVVPRRCESCCCLDEQSVSPRERAW